MPRCARDRIPQRRELLAGAHRDALVAAFLRRRGRRGLPAPLRRGRRVGARVPVVGGLPARARSRGPARANGPRHGGGRRGRGRPRPHPNALHRAHERRELAATMGDTSGSRGPLSDRQRRALRGRRTAQLVRRRRDHTGAGAPRDRSGGRPTRTSGALGVGSRQRELERVRAPVPRSRARLVVSYDDSHTPFRHGMFHDHR